MGSRAVSTDSRESNSAKARFNTLRYFIRLAALTGVEIYKFQSGQSASITEYNMVFYPILLATINEMRFLNIFCVILLNFNIVEIITYRTVRTPITRQILASVDIKYVNKNHPIFYLYVILALAFSTTIGYFSKKGYAINLTISPAIKMIALIMCYPYLIRISSNIKGTSNQIVFNQNDRPLLMRLHSVLYEKPRVIEKYKIKNLILYQIESLENWAVTPTAMPFLYNLTNKYLTYNNIIPVKYAAWTTGATLLTQCGVPQLVIEYEWISRQNDSIGLYSKINCITDYLATEGYKRFHFIAGDGNVNGFDDWRDGKNYSLMISAENDTELNNELLNKFLPEYSVKGEKERFIAWIGNGDTHGPYDSPRKCNPRNRNENKLRQHHNCFDMKLEEFVRKYFDLRMDRHTVLILYPDHPIMIPSIPGDRKLFMTFPGIAGGTNCKRMTYYDFAPTVLESIGIKKVSPGFPFGTSAFSSEVGSVPSDEDMIMMFQFFSQTLNINRGKTKNKFTSELQTESSKVVIEFGH